MKDFLESLELGESKYKLSKEEIKTILSENGKQIKTETDKVEEKYKTEIGTYKTTIDDLKGQIEKSPKSDELESLRTKIADFEKKEADRVAKEQASQKEAIILKNINEAIADKKFVNEYTRNSIINEVKNALLDEANTGKSAKDLFEKITKDKTDIYENPNKPADMPGVGDVETTISKEAFNKMSYNERVELKQTNPALFKKYNN